jgi:hypothetical protein
LESKKPIEEVQIKLLKEFRVKINFNKQYNQTISLASRFRKEIKLPHKQVMFGHICKK